MEGFSVKAPSSSSEENVIDIFSGRPLCEVKNRIVRIAPELDGLEMLYSNDSSPEKLYSLKVACWALYEDGEVVGMVPWLNDIVSCPDIDDPLNGRFEGYRDPAVDDIFYTAPAHKVVELESSSSYYQEENPDDDFIVQEIPDTIGTHAVLTEDGFRTFTLIEVLSWRLMGNGKLSGMLVDDSAVESTPVLPGDACLFSAQDQSEFKYFFQHRIANKIKAQDPEALAAISLLIES